MTSGVIIQTNFPKKIKNLNFQRRRTECPPRRLVILTLMLNQLWSRAGADRRRAGAPAAAATQHPVSIHQAMRHSVFAGGKRLRPILCMEAGRMIAGSLPEGIEDLGAALEMLHTYSLIHDDLPALDNDDLRRGRPTCHKVFGEAIAILAGDALQTQAYEVLSRLRCPAESRVRIIEEIAHGTGTDRWHDRRPGGGPRSRAHQARPRNAGVHSSLQDCGADQRPAWSAADSMQARDDKAVDKLRSFGQSIGLAFQIVDDVLDVTQTSEQLGKTAGKDTAAEKATYPALFGVDESLKKADALVESALTSLGRLRCAGRDPERSGAVPGGEEEVAVFRICPSVDARAHISSRVTWVMSFCGCLW